MDYEQLAEAHQRVADAHAHLADAHQHLADLLLITEAAPPAPLAPQQPEKLRAPDGAFFTSVPDWRQFIIQLEQQLLERFGVEPIYMRRLRNFLEEHVELLPGDLERCAGEGHKSPRWFGMLQSAINCDPSHWPLGSPVIVSAGTCGYYRVIR